MMGLTVLGRLRARLRGGRARLRGDERGFTLLEVMIAVTIIFGSLLAIAYTATMGFGYESLARQKLTAAGIANQVMEEVRGLAYDYVARGLASNDLTGDSNIKACTEMVGGVPTTVYRFLSCLPVAAGSPAGAGEKVIYFDNSLLTAPNVVPLYPHSGTITKNSIAFKWAVYVSNDDTAVTGNPYRVTVLVTWTGGRTALNKLVRLQSLFYSPAGCLSTQTHPFAAPCQPFFYGEATVPQGIVSISGTVSGLTFTQGELLTTAAESLGQQEQLSQVQGSFTQSQASITDAGGTRTAGGTSATAAAADTDPASTTPTWAEKQLISGTGGTVTSPSGGGSTDINFLAPDGDTARTDITVAAGGANLCPPPTDPAETDNQPCAGSRIQQNANGSESPHSLRAYLDLDGFASGLGTARLARLRPPPGPSKTFVNRTVISGEDGRFELTATRSFGTINIGELPSGMTGPANWSGSNAWNGFLISVVNYQDAATAQAGTSAALPTASVSGTVYYWDGASGTYKNVTANSPSLNNLNAGISYTQLVGGHTVVVSIATTSTAPAAASATPTSPGGTATRTDAVGQVTPPSITVSYTITVDGVTDVSLQIAVNLGTMVAHGVYSAAPSPS